MRVLGSLLYKEWRDHRALALWGAGLSAALSVGARLAFGPSFDADLRSDWVGPACLVLLLSAVAADSAAGEVNAGVGDTLGRLPVRRHALWAAKLAFLAAAGVAFQGWLVALELAVRLAFPEEASPRLLRPVLWPTVALSAVAVIAWASLLRRALPAALLGVGSVAGVPLAVPLLEAGAVRDWLALSIDPWTPVTLPAVLGLAFLALSFGSFSPWSSRADDVRRRIAPGVIGFLAVAAPAVSYSVARALSSADLTPHDTSVVIWDASPSPDDRYVAVSVGRTWRGHWNVLSEQRDGRANGTRNEVWILDVESGGVRQVDERVRLPYIAVRDGWTHGPWGADGLLRTVSYDGPFRRGDGEVRREVIDPATGRVVSEVRDPEGEAVQRFEAELGFERWYEVDSDGDQREVRWRGREAIWRGHAHRRELAISPEPGVVLYVEGESLVRVDLGSGANRVLAPVEPPAWLELSPDGRWISVREGRRLRILDARTGHGLHETREHRLLVWLGPGELVAAMYCAGEQFLVTESGTRPIDVGLAWIEGRLGGDLLITTMEEIVVLDPDDGATRLLYAPRGGPDSR